MIRIIFENGELMDVDHIAKMYIEEYEMDQKVTIVGCLKEDADERLSCMGSGETRT